jgi:hypothetical protein
MLLAAALCYTRRRFSALDLWNPYSDERMVGLMNNGTRTQTNRPGDGLFVPSTIAGLLRTMPTMSTPWVYLAPGMGAAGVGARHAVASPTQFQLKVPTRWRC